MTADEGRLVLARGGEQTVVARVDDVPITMGGAARHNVANVLAAIGAAGALGIGPVAMASALRSFGTAPEDNPGRANIYRIGGVVVVIDYAHNPHGMAALADMTRAMPASRRLVLLGQAGDRTDEAIRDLARAAWTLRPDRVVLKEMVRYLRGRRPGEVSTLLTDEFSRLGMPASTISVAGHQDRPTVTALLDQLAGNEWQPGSPLPQ